MQREGVREERKRYIEERMVVESEIEEERKRYVKGHMDVDRGRQRKREKDM